MNKKKRAKNFHCHQAGTSLTSQPHFTTFLQCVILSQSQGRGHLSLLARKSITDMDTAAVTSEAIMPCHSQFDTHKHQLAK